MTKTIKPIIKNISSPNCPQGLQNYYPEEPDSFWLPIEVYIGPKEENWEELFSFELCTCKWLEKNPLASNKLFFPKNYLLIEEFNLNLIEKFLEGLCNKAPTSSWKETAQFLSKFMYWEFENYHE